MGHTACTWVSWGAGENWEQAPWGAWPGGTEVGPDCRAEWCWTRRFS